MFVDWKLCSQDLIPLSLTKDRFYYIQAQAWHLKGYLGGTHSYCVFWSAAHDKFLVVEYTDAETVSYQTTEVVYGGSTDSNRAPFITARPYNAQWFGHNPSIVDSCTFDNQADILYHIINYPLTEFKMLTQNCNTFTSYLIWKLNLKLKRPLKSIGFKNKQWWEQNFNV